MSTTVNGQIFVVGLDAPTPGSLAELLQQEGLTFEVAPAADVVLRTQSTESSVVVLSVPMPDVNVGLLVRDLAAMPAVHVLVLLEEDEEDTELQAFAAGASDVQAMTRDRRILAARIRALQWRALSTLDELTVGPFTMLPESRRLLVNGKELLLTRTEFDLMLAMMERRRHVVTQSDLVSLVWGADPGAPHLLHTHLSRLRGKVAAAGGPRIAHAVRGVGYRFWDPSSSESAAWTDPDPAPSRTR